MSRAIGRIPLLGGHAEDGDSGGHLDHRSPLLFDIVRGIVEQWPQPPDPIRGRSLADVLNSTPVETRRPRSSRAVLRRLIRKVAGFSAAGAVRRLRTDQMEVQTPLPGLGRRSAVLRVLGNEPLLHAGHARGAIRSARASASTFGQCGGDFSTLKPSARIDLSKCVFDLRQRCFPPKPDAQRLFIRLALAAARLSGLTTNGSTTCCGLIFRR